MCIFCQIISKEIDSEVIYEDDEIIAFNDIAPKTKTHILIVPRKHIETIKDLKTEEGDDALVGKMVAVAQKIGKEKNLEGYQLLFNVGKSAGQIVFHIHLHLMSNE